MSTEKKRGYIIEVNAPHPDASESTTDDVLLIDGKVIPYLKTEEGIRIYYQLPQKDLLSAARSFVDTQREKSE